MWGKSDRPGLSVTVQVRLYGYPATGTCSEFKDTWTAVSGTMSEKNKNILLASGHSAWVLPYSTLYMNHNGSLLLSKMCHSPASVLSAMDAIIHWVEQQIYMLVGGAHNHISIVKPLNSSEVHIEGTTDIGKSSHSKRCTMTHYLQTWSNRIVKDRNTVTWLWMDWFMWTQQRKGKLCM